MKKTLACLTIALILSSCDAGSDPSRPTDRNISCYGMSGCVAMDRKEIDGMEYLIFSGNNSSSLSPYVINLTKDKLEVALLKRQLDSTHQK